MPDERQYAPATERNRDVILAVLQSVLPPKGTVLEVSSGTGQHAVYFAPRLQPRTWLPSDPSAEALRSIVAWQRHQPAENLRPPIYLDARDSVWPVEKDAASSGPDSDSAARTNPVGPITAIVNINMLHISPWEAGLGLLAGAGRILAEAGGVLYLYGPFQIQGQMMPSNAAFDQMLRSQNPAWGVRELDDVVAAAQAQGLKLVKQVPMPANNLSLVFKVG
ncbi:MAG: DUF938 domain-containing protein [Elainellaceae cyanobacterium]